MVVNYHKASSRRPWMARTIPELIRKAGRALTLPQITAELNSISNPTWGMRRTKQAAWEYHLGVAAYPEVKTILKRLIAKLIVIEDKNRRPFDPKAGRVRYDLMNPIEALARIPLNSDDKKPEQASLLTAWATRRKSATAR